MIPRLKAYAATVPAGSREDGDKAIGGIARRRLFIEQRLPELEPWLADHPEG
jgi:hypothetical protein